MATIAEQLTSLANTKTAIKDAIVAKGVAVADTDPFSAYPAKIGQIQAGGGAPATKFGVSIDNLLGNVDADGNYTAPTEKIALDLRGVKSIPTQGMYYAFLQKPVVSVDASTVVSIGNYGMGNAFDGCIYLESIDFSSLESLDSYALHAAFRGSILQTVSFPKLTNVASNSFGTSLGKPFPSTVTELHFRADMQATIEAMTGYSSKWGATSSTIYFDL